MKKQIVPVGKSIEFKTGWIWEVQEDNKIYFPSTGQTRSLLQFSAKDYRVLK